MAGDGGVAGLARQRRVGVVPGPALEVGDLHALDDDLVDVDARGCGAAPRRRPRPAVAGAGPTRSVVGGSPSGVVVGGPSSGDVRRPRRCCSSNSVSSWSCACASRMPVPHSWYATNSRMSTPAVMQTRPIAPRTLARRMSGAERTDPRTRVRSRRVGARPRRRPACLGGPRGAVSTLASSPWSRSSTSATPWRCSDDSLRSPASTSTSSAVTSSSSAGPTAQARPRCCARWRASCRWCAARRGCSATTCASTPGRSAAASGCSPTPPGLFDDLTVADNVTFWGRATRAVRRRHRRRPRPGRAGRPAARRGGGPAVGRPAAPHLAGLPAGPAARAVAARRAPRRARQRRPRPARRPRPPGGRPGRDGGDVVPRARPGRGPGRPRRRARRRHDAGPSPAATPSRRRPPTTWPPTPPPRRPGHRRRAADVPDLRRPR